MIVKVKNVKEPIKALYNVKEAIEDDLDRIGLQLLKLNRLVMRLRDRNQMRKVKNRLHRSQFLGNSERVDKMFFFYHHKSLERLQRERNQNMIIQGNSDTKHGIGNRRRTEAKLLIRKKC